ncbi:MAG: bifunctional homocysteine S-methyltransferase/methylenetetrahydrofolate reductase [Thermoanaerobaculales bacterium]|jgi:homocysteine S-methyltransferase|nr:bifunctional homocysteine S-methyltransferase/methylenetetrahydrofolate reductase [Thermoanaerobaculales bacterium]
MSASIRRRFSDRVVVADGAMGSELLGRLPADVRLDLAPLSHPEAVLDIHLAYLEAGAELIETASFGASRPRLVREQAGDEVEAVNSAAVKLARDAREIAGVDCLVAGAIGPLAGVIDLDEPEGPPAIAAAHAEQARVLAGRGADLLILETFFRFDELALAVRAVRGVCDLPLVGLLTFATERPPHAYEEQARVVDELADLELLAVGVNCAPGPMGALEILRNTRQTTTPLAAIPNAGVLSRRDGRIFMPPATPAYLARFARQAVELGASLVGGCCGTGPEHIRAIAEAVRGLRPERRETVAVSMAAPEPEVTARPVESSLAGKLAAGDFVRLVQLDPPKGANADLVLAAAEALARHPAVDAVDINSNPLARLRMDSLSLAAEIQRRTGLETVPHITPRDASLMGLQSQLLGAWLNGVRNLFAVTGDPSQLGDYPGVHDVYHVDIFELVRSVSRLAEGFDCAGNRIGDPPSFFTGVAVSPTVDDLAHEADRLRRKIDNGAHFVMSQVFFEWAPWERFLELFGGALPIPALVAVWPVRSLKMALRLHHEVPGIEVPQDMLDEMEAAGAEAGRVGRERALRLFREAPRYADGVYLIAPFKRPEEVLPLIDEAMG